MQDMQLYNTIMRDLDQEGKTLPTVSDADAGKVLTVADDGKWEAGEYAEEYAGYDAVCLATVTGDESATVEIIKGSFTDMWAKAYTNHKPISMLVSLIDGDAFFTLAGDIFVGDDDGYCIAYYGYTNAGANHHLAFYWVEGDEIVDIVYRE